MSTELNLFDMPGAPERPLDELLRPDDIMFVQDLKMHFPVTKGLLKRQVGSVKAVDGVTFMALDDLISLHVLKLESNWF